MVLFVVSNVVSRFCSLNVILKCLKMSVLPRRRGTSSESAKDMWALRVVWPILMLVWCVYAGMRVFPIPMIGRYCPL